VSGAQVFSIARKVEPFIQKDHATRRKPALALTRSHKKYRRPPSREAV